MKCMKTIGAYEAKTHLPRLLDRVVRGESLTITRHGRPVARLVPVEGPLTRAKDAAARIRERRQRIAGAPLADLIASIHEGHRR
jgi:prevent-host-death family protein